MSKNDANLFELMRILWSGKWVIFICVTVMMSAGFIYSKFAKPEYKVSVELTFDIVPATLKTPCLRDLNCIRNFQRKKLFAALDDGWLLNRNNTLTRFTTDAKKAADYKVELEKLNHALTISLLDEAKKELIWVEASFPGAVLSTTYARIKMFAIKEAIRDINNGQTFLKFERFSVLEISPATPMILVLCFIFGKLSGVLVILIQRALQR